VAVALSGGVDSMALAFLLSRWSNESGGPLLHALTVDHGLRPGSADEAARVGDWVKGWPKLSHTVLTWEGEKPGTGVMEAARNTRYALMAGYCKQHGMGHLFIAHHRDDQAETFLMRLCKGSGLDGLSGMRAEQRYDDSLTLLRPLLSTPKSALLDVCAQNKIPYVTDPSNTSPLYMRPRLRKAMEEEGMGSARLARTAARLARARDTLDQLAGQAFLLCVRHENTRRSVIDSGVLGNWPEEIMFRVFLKAVDAVRGQGHAYSPRMERLEDIFESLCGGPDFRRRTLGGCAFAREGTTPALWVIEREKNE